MNDHTSIQKETTMSTLTHEQYDALQARLDWLEADAETLFDAQKAAERDALEAVIAGRPKSVLRDGVWLNAPDSDGDRMLRFVKGGRWSYCTPRTDGTFCDDGIPLPDDTSGWTWFTPLTGVPSPDDDEAVEALTCRLADERSCLNTEGVVRVLLGYLRGESS